MMGLELDNNDNSMLHVKRYRSGIDPTAEYGVRRFASFSLRRDIFTVPCYHASKGINNQVALLTATVSEAQGGGTRRMKGERLYYVYR